MSDLTPLAPLPADLTPRPQTLGRIARAEVGRLLRQGGLVGALSVSLLAALVVGLGALPVAARLGRDDPYAPIVTPLSLASATAALVLVVGIALHVGGHGQRGTGAATLVLVPDRRRLLAARALAIAALAACHLSLVVLVVGTVAGAATDARVLPVLALGLLGSALGGALIAVLGAAVAVLVDHPVVAALTLGGWWVVLPITAAALSGLLPGPLAAIGDAVVATTPSLLAIRATDPGGDLSVLSVLGGVAGLAVWAVALGAVASAIFERRTISRKRGELYP